MLAAALAPAQAQAQDFPHFGISQSYRDFGIRNGAPGVDVSSSKFWPGLQIKTLRVVIPWDIGNRPPSDGRRQEFQRWLDRIGQLEQLEGHEIEPLVTFGVSELHGVPGVGTNAPTVSRYRSAIANFLAIWGPQGSSTAPPVRIIGAWNEPNVGNVDMSIPGGIDGPVYLPGGQRMDSSTCAATPVTADNCGPRMAAFYWKEVRDQIAAACEGSGLPGCYSVAGEFDGTPADYSYWNAYADQIDQLIDANYPRQIAFHGWRDGAPLNGKGHDCIVEQAATLNQCASYTFFKWLEGRTGTAPWDDRSYMRIWNTEAGAKYMSGESSSDPPDPGLAQRERVRNLIMASNRYGVVRIYYYNFQYQGAQQSGDSGLIETGDVDFNQRPAWWWIKDRLPE